MFTEDYIVRILSQAIAALQEALGLRKRGRYGEGLEVIQVALEGLFGIPSALLYRMDFNSLLEILSNKDQLDLDRASVAADLFAEAGNLYDAMGLEGNALASKARALDLYLTVALAQPDKIAPQKDEAIVTLDIQLQGRHPIDTINLLFYYYERRGNLQGSLKALDLLLEFSDYDSGIVSDAFEFYQHLLEMGADELSEAGLQPGEIEARLKALRGE